MVDSVTGVNFDGMLFAAEATKPQSQRRGGAVLTGREEIIQEAHGSAGLDNEVEFQWQSTADGGDGQPPPRKRQMAFALRRLFRLRNEQSFRTLSEFGELFQGEQVDLKRKGEKNFMNDVSAAEVAKQGQKQVIRKTLMKLQLRIGEQSISNAFTIWKENSVLQKRVQRVKEINETIKQQAAMQHEIQQELQNELADAEAELVTQKKEFERNKTWLNTKLKRIELQSKSK